MNLFLDLNAWLSAVIFAGLMLVGWWIGLRVRAAVPRPAETSPAPSTRIEDAALTLFGLLLAFCFYGAAERYEHRKQLLRDDAVAIGELASVGSDLEEPDRGADAVRALRQIGIRHHRPATGRFDRLGNSAVAAGDDDRPDYGGDRAVPDMHDHRHTPDIGERLAG